MEDLVSHDHYVMYDSYTRCCVIGDDEPSMKDLHINVVHQYAAHWERLGLKLGLQNYDIANISKDNDNGHTSADHSVNCCAMMLEKWLLVVYSPT